MALPENPNASRRECRKQLEKMMGDPKYKDNIESGKKTRVRFEHRRRGAARARAMASIAPLFTLAQINGKQLTDFQREARAWIVHNDIDGLRSAVLIIAEIDGNAALFVEDALEEAADRYEEEMNNCNKCEK